MGGLFSLLRLGLLHLAGALVAGRRVRLGLAGLRLGRHRDLERFADEVDLTRALVGMGGQDADCHRSDLVGNDRPGRAVLRIFNADNLCRLVEEAAIDVITALNTYCLIHSQRDRVLAGPGGDRLATGRRVGDTLISHRGGKELPAVHGSVDAHTHIHPAEFSSRDGSGQRVGQNGACVVLPFLIRICPGTLLPSSILTDAHLEPGVFDGHWRCRIAGLDQAYCEASDGIAAVALQRDVGNAVLELIRRADEVGQGGLPVLQVRRAAKGPGDLLPVQAARVRRALEGLDVAWQLIRQLLSLCHNRHEVKVCASIRNRLCPVLFGVVREAALDGEGSPRVHVELARGDAALKAHENAIKLRRAVVRGIADQAGLRPMLGPKLKTRLLGREEPPAVGGSILAHAHIHPAKVLNRDGGLQCVGQLLTLVVLPHAFLARPLTTRPVSALAEANSNPGPVNGHRLLCRIAGIDQAHREACDLAFLAGQRNVGGATFKLRLRADVVRQGGTPGRVPRPAQRHAVQPRVGLPPESEGLSILLIAHDIFSVFIDPPQGKLLISLALGVVHFRPLAMVAVAVRTPGEGEFPGLGVLYFCALLGLEAKVNPRKLRVAVVRLVADQPGLRPVLGVEVNFPLIGRGEQPAVLAGFPPLGYAHHDAVELLGRDRSGQHVVQRLTILVVLVFLLLISVRVRPVVLYPFSPLAEAHPEPGPVNGHGHRHRRIAGRDHAHCEARDGLIGVALQLDVGSTS